jgi:hypothetical protein
MRYAYLNQMERISSTPIWIHLRLASELVLQSEPVKSLATSAQPETPVGHICTLKCTLSVVTQ